MTILPQTELSHKTLEELGGSIQKILRWPDPADNRWSAYNPSIARRADGSLFMLIRSSNYVLDKETGRLTLTVGGDIWTRIWIAELDKKFNIENLRELKITHGPHDVQRGIEDPRVFQRDGKWFFTAVMYEPPVLPFPRICVYALDTENATASFIEKFEGPVVRMNQKNWLVSDIANDNFDFIYDRTSVYKDNAVVPVREEVPALKGLRGGTNLIAQKDGTYLALVHRVSITSFYGYNPRTFSYGTDYKREYQHLFARYDAHGRLTHLSPEFIFESPGIEYASGMIEDPKTGGLIISYGKEDVCAWLAFLPKQTAVDMLVPVN